MFSKHENKEMNFVLCKMDLHSPVSMYILDTLVHFRITDLCYCIDVHVTE